MSSADRDSLPLRIGVIATEPRSERVRPAADEFPADLSGEERKELTRHVEALLSPKSHAFLDQIARHGPFDYVLDGANIGYFGKSIQLDKLHKARRRQTTSEADEHAGVGRGPPGGEQRARGARARSTSQIFSFEQVDAVLRAAEEGGTRVLVVLNVAHTEPKLINEQGAQQLQQWRERGTTLLTSPKG